MKAQLGPAPSWHFADTTDARTEAAEHGGDPRVRYHLGLDVWARGGHKSACVAQLVHESSFAGSAECRKIVPMKYDEAFPGGPTRFGIYVEDVLVVSEVSQKELPCFEGSADHRVVQAAVMANLKAGL